MGKKTIRWLAGCALVLSMLLEGCTGEGSPGTESSEVPYTAVQPSADRSEDTEKEKDTIMEFHSVELTKGGKINTYTNPLITQHYGADPYAMEYDGRLYIYMTADAYEYEADGSIKENSYSKIKSIYVISTDDMVNFTDHGEIRVAGSDGPARWAHNSWAPAACWKNIDGQDKFFLYFADNGGGIGVLTADSPVGPFTDPLGHGLVTRSVPTCAEVTWLFDPAVLVDDDGQGYLYFGGGVPEGKVSHPGTARVCKLGADMISLEGDPVPIDAPYLFEDSGIHKFGNRYYYSYCTNWQVDHDATAQYGFTNADIVTMESDSPMGPFTYKEVILKNPGTVFGLYGNNHHCVFSFLGQWYITYHARTLEKQLKIEKGYRSTHIDCVTIAEDGTIGRIRMTNDGRTQLKNVDAYAVNSAACCSMMTGAECAPLDQTSKACGSGNMYVTGFDAGDYIKVTGVDFGSVPASGISIHAAGAASPAEIYFGIDYPKSTPCGGVKVAATASEAFTEYTAELTTPVSGVHDLYIVCASGEDVQLLDWHFFK